MLNKYARAFLLSSSLLTIASGESGSYQSVQEKIATNKNKDSQRPYQVKGSLPHKNVLSHSKKIKKAKIVKASKDPHKDDLYCEPRSAVSAKPVEAVFLVILPDDSPNGWALSLVGGALFSKSEIKNKDRGFDLKYNINYTNFGLGVNYYKTYSNHVMWSLGLDLLGVFGGGTTVDATFTSSTPTTVSYKQTRPCAVIVSGKLGYVCDFFIPYLSLGLKETYIHHNVGGTTVKKDVVFAVTPGGGAMFKSGNYGFGLEYGYNFECQSRLGVYQEKSKHKSQVVMARISYFF
jgi:hypothetical protein